jgi:hypothetical protein
MVEELGMNNIREGDYVRLYFGEVPIFDEVGLVSHFSEDEKSVLVLWIDRQEASWEPLDNLALWEW